MKAFITIFFCATLAVIGFGWMNIAINSHNPIPDSRVRPAPTPSIDTPTFRESIQKELAEGNAIMAENAKYLRLVKSSWKFDESYRHVAWTATIENKSNASIGNIIFSTRYADRHGNILPFHNGENGDEANRLDLGINGPIKAHSTKTFTVLDDITEPMVILDAEKASFTIVGAGDWMQRVLK
jgi:hypothetical protein